MNDDNARKERAALASIFASAGLTVAKFIAGLLTGSLGLLSEAGHGLLDTGATTLTYFAVKEASKPADDEHPYGHGKIEAVAALAETGLLLVLAVVVVAIAIYKLFSGTEIVKPNLLAFAVLLISMVVDLVRWRSLAKIARETRSDALAADALHFSSDLVSSGLVLVGLTASAYGFEQGDALAAIGVALFIAFAGYRLGRRTIDTLVDTAPAGLADQIKDLAQTVSGVVDVETVKLRRAGSEFIGDVGIAVPRTMPLERVATVKAQVETALLDKFPDGRLTITANPRVLDTETILERTLLMSALQRLPVHHITVHKVGEKTSISMDVEVDRRMSLASAHERASRLEVAIRAELGEEVEVETHIEPLDVVELEGKDVEPSALNEITQVLCDAAVKTDAIFDIHSVRARGSETGIVVNYHCRAAGQLSVEAVHVAVDQIDRVARAKIPQIKRIVGHAEPIRVSRT